MRAARRSEGIKSADGVLGQQALFVVRRAVSMGESRQACWKVFSGAGLR